MNNCTNEYFFHRTLNWQNHFSFFQGTKVNMTHWASRTQHTSDSLGFWVFLWRLLPTVFCCWLVATSLCHDTRLGGLVLPLTCLKAEVTCQDSTRSPTVALMSSARLRACRIHHPITRNKLWHVKWLSVKIFAESLTLSITGRHSWWWVAWMSLFSTHRKKLSLFYAPLLRTKELYFYIVTTVTINFHRSY